MSFDGTSGGLHRLSVGDNFVLLVNKQDRPIDAWQNQGQA